MQADVDDRHLGAPLCDQIETVADIVCLAANLQIWFLIDQFRQPLTEHRMIFNEDDGRLRCLRLPGHVVANAIFDVEICR